MFSSYDLKQFGENLKETRRKSGLTQKKISELSGIHIDTLRRIENGLVIPKYETIELLSTFYKTDLFEVLYHTRNDEDLINLYNQLDICIVNNNIGLLEQTIQLFQNFISSKSHQYNIINHKDISLIELFLDGAQLYHTGTQENLERADHLLSSNLGIDITSSHFENMTFDHMEIRILLLLSVIKLDYGTYEDAIRLLVFLLDYLTNNSFANSNSIKLISKIYVNLSYCHHMLGNHELALSYADEGINHGINHQSLYILFALYYRKGIAEFKLNNKNYKSSLHFCCVLLRMEKQFDLLETYYQSTKRIYNIDLKEFII